MRKKTHEEYVEWVQKNRSDYEVIGTYIKSNISIDHRHILCGNIWPITPGNFKRGKSCPKCNGGILKTHEQYVTELDSKKSDYQVIEKYITAKIPILHKHLKCGHIWKIAPDKILGDRGCPKCARLRTIIKLTITHDEYVKELEVKAPDFETMEKYKKARLPILHRHKICGYSWLISPDNLIRNQGCPQCAGMGYVFKKYPELYLNQLKEKKIEYEPLEEFKSSNIPIYHIHINCGHKWRVRPSSILKGHGCPQCMITGYRVNKKGRFYWFIIEHNSKKYVKFGITNVFNDRMRNHRKNLREESIKFDKNKVKFYEFDNGQHALDIENSIKNNFQLESLPIDGFKTEVIAYENLRKFKAHVVKLVDTLALGASA